MSHCNYVHFLNTQADLVCIETHFDISFGCIVVVFMVSLIGIHAYVIWIKELGFNAHLCKGGETV